MVSHAFAFSSAVVSVPVVHPPGTFSQGSLPTFITTPSGAKITTHSGMTTSASQTAAPSKTTAAVVVTPKAVVVTPNAVVTPPVVHSPGTFSQGELPTFITTPSGAKITFHSFRF